MSKVPPTVIPLVKEENADEDPLSWATESFAMESVNVIAAGTAAAEGDGDDDEATSYIGEPEDTPNFDVVEEDPDEKGRLYFWIFLLFFNKYFSTF